MRAVIVMINPLKHAITPARPWDLGQAALNDSLSGDLPGGWDHMEKRPIASISPQQPANQDTG